ncbi:BMC domain-containing protein [Helicovermis profundi]|uniref:BMC domain-containing protein n=1 Tax=Helicovermis profundi TaxID=3065157 RepID=A0AAU9ESD5_9FIRM|nr:BMC domain-containing protein [Clostridia bacterium S502]
MKKALGFFEIRSMVAAIYAADVMVKAANVVIKDYNVVGSGVIAVVVEGDVSAVKAAVESAERLASPMAEVISVNVIPRPEEELDILFDDN